MELSPGTRVGSFEILAPLGAGGMGSVYRARDTKLGREVAIKIVQDKLLGSHEHLERFEREARAASALNHPNIITIYDIGEYEQAPFIAMELVEGQQLREILKRGPVPLRKLLQIGAQIADGLAAAHERKIVHRDLKPENIMITPDGRVKILDFGLARLQREPTTESPTSDLVTVDTPDGLVIGTAAYMSPEQANGSALNHRSDQFALGTVLWEMATGKHPFRRATTFDTLSAIVHDEPPPIEHLNPKIPQPLCWLIKRCLEKDSRERYDSTRDLAHELRGLSQRLLETTPVAGFERGVGLTRNRAVLFSAVAVVILVALPVAWKTRSTIGDSLPARKCLLVLPFKDLSGRSSDQLRAAGLAQVVSTRLATDRSLQVIAPAAVPDSGAEDYRKLAGSLGANLVLAGTMKETADSVHITYSIFKPQDGVQVAAGDFRGDAGDWAGIESELANRVAGSLGLPGLSDREPSTLSVENQDRYLEALGYLRRYENLPSVNAAIDILETLRRRSSSPLLPAALARAYLYKYNLTHERTWADQAQTAAAKAAALDASQPEVQITLGEISALRENPEKAARHFRAALAEQPQNVDATLGLARALRASGRAAEAEATYKQAVALRPNYWATYNRLGAFYMASGRPVEAAEMFRRVVSLAPDNVRGYNNLGVALQQTGKYAEAVAAFESSIEIQPNADALSNLGTCLYFLGRFSEAVRAFERAVALAPNRSVLWSNLADAYRWTPSLRTKADDAYRRAVLLAEEELRVNKRNASAHATLAKSLARLGKRDRALEHIQTAVELDPNDVQITYLAAVVAVANGDQQEALKWLQKAIQNGYHSSEAAADPEFASLRSRPEFRAIVGKSPAAKQPEEDART